MMSVVDSQKSAEREKHDLLATSDFGKFTRSSSSCPYIASLSSSGLGQVTGAGSSSL